MYKVWCFSDVWKLASESEVVFIVLRSSSEAKKSLEEFSSAFNLYSVDCGGSDEKFCFLQFWRWREIRVGTGACTVFLCFLRHGSVG